MKKNLAIILVVSCLLAACGNKAVNNTIPILEPVDDVVTASAEYNGSGNHSDSPYYKTIDFYNGKNISKTLLLLPKFSTYQQTSERSCGAACIIMVDCYLSNRVLSEKQLDKDMDIRYVDNAREDGSYGASTISIVNKLIKLGYKVSYSKQTQDEDGYSFATAEEFAGFVKEHLKKGKPILVENVEYGGHWMVMIGYDNMGTEDVTDDILIFADPYDVNDHMQDGYIVRSLERYFYQWYDFEVMSTEEKIQQYVAIE